MPAISNDKSSTATGLRKLSSLDSVSRLGMSAEELAELELAQDYTAGGLQEQVVVSNSAVFGCTNPCLCTKRCPGSCKVPRRTAPGIRPVTTREAEMRPQEPRRAPILTRCRWCRPGICRVRIFIIYRPRPPR